MNPILVLNAIATAAAMIEGLTKLVLELKKSISEHIPDDQLRQETFQDTVNRLKLEGKIPLDYAP